MKVFVGIYILSLKEVRMIVNIGHDERPPEIERIIFITYIVYLVIDHIITVAIVIYFIRKFRQEMHETFIIRLKKYSQFIYINI